MTHQKRDAVERSAGGRSGALTSTGADSLFARGRADLERLDARKYFERGLHHARAGEIEEAVEWFRRAAEQGAADAQAELGFRYFNGDGMPEDYREAVRWFRRAADQGHTDAQTELGFMYANGHGVPRDYREAGRWYRVAADQGNAIAQYNLGSSYLRGEGVEQDGAEAQRWFSHAAEQGHTEAQFMLSTVDWSQATLKTAGGEED